MTIIHLSETLRFTLLAASVQAQQDAINSAKSLPTSTLIGIGAGAVVLIVIIGLLIRRSSNRRQRRKARSARRKTAFLLTPGKGKVIVKSEGPVEGPAPLPSNYQTPPDLLEVLKENEKKVEKKYRATTSPPTVPQPTYPQYPQQPVATVAYDNGIGTTTYTSQSQTAMYYPQSQASKASVYTQPQYYPHYISLQNTSAIGQPYAVVNHPAPPQASAVTDGASYTYSYEYGGYVKQAAFQSPYLPYTPELSPNKPNPKQKSTNLVQN